MASIMEIMQLCRLCLVKDQVNIPIFEEQGDIRNILLKISACLPVKVSKEDKLPKKICDGCSYKLDLLYQFWNTAANAEKQLITWIAQAGADNKKTSDVTKSQENALAEVGIVLKQEVLDPSETRTEDKISDDTHSYILQQQQLPYQPFAFSGTSAAPTATVTSEEVEEPPAKRPRRVAAAAAAAAATSMAADESESEDDNLDTEEMGVTKTEEDSEAEVDDPEPAFVDVPSTSADVDQPGPSGIGKTPATDAPLFGSQKIGLVPLQTLLQGNPSTCRTCKEIFPNYNLLRRHTRKVHHPKRHHCSMCSKNFSSPEERETHKKEEHATKGFPCQFCEKQYATRTGLVNHSEIHLVNPNFKCEQCDQTVGGRQALKRHMQKVHNEMLYACEICYKVFTTDGNRKKHLKKHDSTYSRIQCEYCDKSFSDKPTKMKHVRRTHLGEEMCRGVVCDVCGLKLTEIDNLLKHQRTHTGEKPFVCEHCGRSFARFQQLKIHSVVHTKERKHSCTECQKTFTQRGSLRLHIRSVHQKKKPFECLVCQKRFLTSTLLKVHKRNTHGIPLAEVVIDRVTV